MGLNNANHLTLLNYARPLSGCAHPTRASDWTTTTDGHLPDTRTPHSSDRLEYILGCVHLIVRSDRVQETMESLTACVTLSPDEEIGRF